MKKKNMPVLIVFLLVILVAAAGIITQVIRKYTPTKKMMNLTEYYGASAEGEAALILGTNLIEERAVTEGEQVYLPLGVVNQYLNQRFYWDEEGQQILYATPSELIKMPVQTQAGAQVYQKENQIYLDLAFVQAYTDMDVYKNENPSRIAIQYEFDKLNTVTVTKNTKVRYRGGIKAEILTEVHVGDTLRLLEEFEEWYKVATADGYIGFVEKKHVSLPTETTIERNPQFEQYTYHTMDGYVNLVWHQVMSQEANEYFADAVKNVSGVNVISPTWFSIADNNGNVKSIASSSYVEQAHAKGMQVWALIDNFAADVSTTQILSKTSTRQNLIQNLISAALEAGVDGINVDFEYLSEEVGVHFLQFLRELSIECHKNQLVLSVDNPVPEDFTSHYDRREQGKIVDYVIIMGYDEHYVGSESAGPVASLPWVEKGITDTLAEVPAERVINAMPFYTRIWKISAGILTSEAVGMDYVQETLNSNHVETYWNTDVGQNYGEYELDGDLYKVWIEDSRSIASKTQLASKYKLAGVAAWKLGLENSGIWQTIQENLTE